MIVRKKVIQSLNITLIKHFSNVGYLKILVPENAISHSFSLISLLFRINVVIIKALRSDC